MKKELVRLFAIPILITKYQSDFKKELNYIKKIKLVENGTNKNFKSIDSYILKNKIFKNLKTFFEDSLKVYDEEIFNTNQKVFITQSWVNFNPKGSIRGTYQPCFPYLLFFFFFLLPFRACSNPHGINGTIPLCCCAGTPA